MNRKQITKIIRWLDEVVEDIANGKDTAGYALDLSDRTYNNLTASIALLENELAFGDIDDYTQEEYQTH